MLFRFAPSRDRCHGARFYGAFVSCHGYGFMTVPLRGDMTLFVSLCILLSCSLPRLIYLVRILLRLHSSCSRISESAVPMHSGFLEVEVRGSVAPELQKRDGICDSLDFVVLKKNPENIRAEGESLPREGGAHFFRNEALKLQKSRIKKNSRKKCKNQRVCRAYIK